MLACSTWELLFSTYVCMFCVLMSLLLFLSPYIEEDIFDLIFSPNVFFSFSAFCCLVATIYYSLSILSCSGLVIIWICLIVFFAPFFFFFFGILSSRSSTMTAQESIPHTTFSTLCLVSNLLFGNGLSTNLLFLSPSYPYSLSPQMKNAP